MNTSWLKYHDRITNLMIRLVHTHNLRRSTCILHILHTNTNTNTHTHTHTHPKSSLFLYTLGCRTFFAVEFSPMGFLRQSLLWKKLIFSKNFCYVGWFDFLTHMCLPSSSPHLVAIILPSPCCHHPPLTLLPSSSPHLVAIILPSPCCHHPPLTLLPSSSPHLVAIILPSPCCHHPPLTLLPSSSPHLVAQPITFILSHQHV